MSLLVISTGSFAQCDKKVKLTSSKTEYLDSAGTVQRTVDETTVIEISKPDITIAPGSEENKMTGTIKSDTCNWKIPFKEGKTVLKATITDRSGDTKDVTLTIQGKDGKLNFLAEVDNEQDKKIRLTIDKFEEKK